MNSFLLSFFFMTQLVFLATAKSVFASQTRPLFSKEELEYLAKLKGRNPIERRTENVRKRLVSSSLAPFKATIEMEREDYKKYLKKLNGHYFDQIERTILYKNMFDDFLKSE